MALCGVAVVKIQYGDKMIFILDQNDDTVFGRECVREFGISIHDI